MRSVSGHWQLGRAQGNSTSQPVEQQVGRLSIIGQPSGAADASLSCCELTQLGCWARLKCSSSSEKGRKMKWHSLRRGRRATGGECEKKLVESLRSEELAVVEVG